MPTHEEPFVKVVSDITEAYEVLRTAKISEDLISFFIEKVKEHEIVITVIKNKMLIGFVSAVLNNKGELENVYTTFSISRYDKK